MLADNETVDDNGEIVALEMDDTVEEESLECKSLGMLGVHDTSSKGARTMRIVGSINGISLMVLIDLRWFQLWDYGWMSLRNWE